MTGVQTCALPISIIRARPSPSWGEIENMKSVENDTGLMAGFFEFEERNLKVLLRIRRPELEEDVGSVS